MNRHEVTTRRVLYEIPGMTSVHVRASEYPGADGQPLPMAFYEALNPINDPPPMASGMTAVTHSNENPVADAAALLKHLQGNRIGLWATSGHAPVALAVLADAECAVLSNPMVGEVVPRPWTSCGPN